LAVTVDSAAAARHVPVVAVVVVDIQVVVARVDLQTGVVVVVVGLTPLILQRGSLFQVEYSHRLDM
jgi:hypothetical protein